MELRKMTMPSHRYPTRWKLNRYLHASPESSFSQVSRENYDKDSDEEAVVHPRKRRNTEVLLLQQIPYLPREIVFNILIHVPAESLHDSVRYVCKQWFDIITNPEFVTLHRRQMNRVGFHFQRPKLNKHEVYYIQPEDDTAALKVKLLQGLSPVEISCVYNGLVLCSDSTNPEIFHVVDPATKLKVMSLPPLSGFRHFYQHISFAVDSLGHYKVFHVSDINSEFSMRVFTIGVDKAWRFIDLQGMTTFNDHWTTKRLMLERPHCFRGFIYWFDIMNYRKWYRLCLAMDVDTETIYRFSLPDCVVKGYHPTDVVGVGIGGVGLIYRMGFTWKLFKLTDVKYGEWTEVACIDVRDLCCQFGYDKRYLYLTPVRLFRGDLWLYCRCDPNKLKSIVVRYNVANESFKVFWSEIPSWVAPAGSSSKHMVFTHDLQLTTSPADL